MVATDLVTTLPVTGTERHHTATAHTTTAMTHRPVVTTMRRGGHHSRRSVTISTTVIVVAAAHIVRRAGADSRERASEASSSTLEVGEPARRAGPVTRPRAVLARRERSQYVLSAVEDTAGGGRDLNGLLIKGTTIHTKALSGL
jgi:hypothetical protein